MQNTDSRHRPTGSARKIGPIGTTARTIVGTLLVGSAVRGHLAGPFRPAAWALGLLGFPTLLLGWQWLRARRTPTRLEATGPVANVVNLAVLLALYLTPEYAPTLAVTSDAALLFYGGSMLLAAVRGYAGCEVLAVSNWLLGRDDQIGCLAFWPIDHAERRRAHAERSAKP
jgi:hypothetical protein